MLETTRIVGEPPDRQLVYSLRQQALHGVDLPGLLTLIADRLRLPEGEIGHFVIVLYLSLAFGVRIPEGKWLAARVDRTKEGYIITEASAGDAVLSQIEANRSEWSTTQGPTQL